MKRLILIVGLLALPLVVQAHPGRTDSTGCHTCKTNCPNWGLDYGDYHCHTSKGLPQPEEPIRSIRGEPTGTTVPAPEYKIPRVIQSTQNTSYVQGAQSTFAPPQPEKKRNVFIRIFSWLF